MLENSMEMLEIGVWDRPQNVHRNHGIFRKASLGRSHRESVSIPRSLKDLEIKQGLKMVKMKNP